MSFYYHFLTSYNGLEKRILFLILCLFLLIPVSVNRFIALANGKYTICFYNPETNINNFATLKKEFDIYLSDFGEYQFQPFNKHEIFDNFIFEKKNCLFLISSWHYKHLKNTVPLEPCLVAISRNKSMCKRILSTSKKYKKLDSLKGITVASASNEDYTRNILCRMMGEKNKDIVDSIKILPVPKDIDALMSVGFNVADAALTTENSLAKFAAINHKQYRNLNQILASEEILLPILAMTKPKNDECLKLIKILKDMGMRTEGKRVLKMLGLDNWKELDDSEKRILENQ